ncbi:hypothetical protein JCM5353_005749 [Sporobolomyces roseus]
MVGLFAQPQSVHDPEREAVKQSVFLQLKTITVPLLDASRSPVSSNNTRTTIDLLAKLQSTLEDTPSYAFSPALANYAFFPLSSLLQPRSDGINRGDRILEVTMQALGALIRRWRQAGMEEKVRKELWTMTVLSLGGPLASKDSVKGKAVDRTEESKLAMVEVLEELMRAEPTEEEEASNWTAFDELPVQAKKDTAPPRSILFHTLTTLLGLAADPTSLVQLQLSSIASLRTLTLHYLAPTLDPASRPSPLLATALPGMASTLSRIALSKPPSSKASLATPNRKQTSSVVVQALDLLSTLVTLSVSDIVTRGLRSNGKNSSTSIVALEQLADQEHESSLQSVSEPGPPESNDPPSPPVPEGMTIPTPAWLRFTITSLSTLFVALSPLTSHHSPSVRTAFVRLLSIVVQRCSATFDIHLETPIEGLLILSSDSWDEVCDPARRTLANLLETPPLPSDQAIPSLISFANIVQRRLASLPLALRKHDEDGIRRSANVIQSALDALPVAQPLESLLANMSRWSWNVTAAVELERIMGTSEGPGMGMSLAWIEGGRHETKEASQSLPRIRLRNVHEDATIDSLEKLWFAFGAAAAKSKKEDALIDHFFGIVLGPRRGESAAVSSLWILDGVMRGIQSVSTDKRRKKVLKGVVKAVIALLGGMEGNEEKVESTLDEREGPQPQNLDSSSLLNQVDGIPLIQHNKGVTSIPSLDDYKPVVAKSTPALDRASHHILLLSLSLRLLGTLSRGLSSSFQPFLLPSLYHVLASTSATAHPFLRLHAQITLAIVAESTSFTSPQQLVLANVDYIVNSVSQRLSVTRLDTSAPLVLVEMIRLVGQPIVPIVQDLVDDVFEALDDFHGYQEVTVGLWAVLDALLKVMEEDLPSNDDHQSKGRSVSIESTFDSFKTWFVSRKEKEEEPDEETGNPQKPFNSNEATEEKDGTIEFPESKEVAPTRSQAVTSQILSKSLYFLSHPSSFLRARVLSLLASAVPLLAQPSLDSKSPHNRSADLLPIIHRAWPFILNRLAESELSVVCEAATLVESLACHVGDFMSRRILEDVWPRFRTLLAQQEVNDLDSALAGSTRYSTSHRLYGSILRTLVKVAQSTPLKEDVVWEQGVLLRRFLASSIDSELRNHAFKLYELLGKVNRDAVWLVLAGSLGTVEGLPKFLEMSTVDFDGSVEDLLERM